MRTYSPVRTLSYSRTPLQYFASSGEASEQLLTTSMGTEPTAFLWAVPTGHAPVSITPVVSADWMRPSSGGGIDPEMESHSVFWSVYGFDEFDDEARPGVLEAVVIGSRPRTRTSYSERLCAS